MAVKANGAAYVMGALPPYVASITDPATPMTSVPGTASTKAITGLSASSIFAGSGAALAVGSDGQLRGWGNDFAGSLAGGDSGFNTSVITPKVLSGVSSVAIGVLQGGGTSFALRTDGTLWHWPGTMNGSTNAVTPRQVTGLTGVFNISPGPGTYNLLVVKADGTVWMLNDRTRQVSGADDIYSFTANSIGGLADVRGISCSANHCLVLKNDGTLASWGDNTYGQLGIGNQTGSTSPLPSSGPSSAVTALPVLNITGAVSIATTNFGSVAVTANGSVWSWGRADNVGRGASPSPITSPTLVPGLTNAVEVSCQGTTCVIRTSTGQLWGWGSNVNGELGDGTTAAQYGPVQAVGVDLN